MNLGGREACASAPRRGQDRGLRRSPLCHSALSPPVPPGSALERAVPGCIEFLFVTTSAVCSREIARVLLWLAAFLWCNSWPSQSIAGAPRAERWIVTGKALGIKKKKKLPLTRQTQPHTRLLEGPPGRQPALFCCKPSGQACLPLNPLALGRVHTIFKVGHSGSLSRGGLRCQPQSTEPAWRPRPCSGGLEPNARLPRGTLARQPGLLLVKSTFLAVYNWSWTNHSGQSSSQT